MECIQVKVSANTQEIMCAISGGGGAVNNSGEGTENPERGVEGGTTWAGGGALEMDGQIWKEG